MRLNPLQSLLTPADGDHWRPNIATLIFLAITFCAGCQSKPGGDGSTPQAGQGPKPAGAEVEVAERATPAQLLSGLPQDKHPKPGPDGQAERDAANEWLKANVAGKIIDVPFIVDDVEILDQGDGTHQANLRVTIDSKLDGPASLGDGVWGGDFKLNGIPYYIEYWGENPLWSGLSQADAEKLRGLKGKTVSFRCKTNDFELQEGDDATQLKLVVTFAEIKPPEDKPAVPATSPEVPLVADHAPAAKKDRSRLPAENVKPDQPAAKPEPPAEIASAGPSGVLQLPEPGSILDVAWSPDGRHVAAFDAYGMATLWDVTTSRGRNVSPTNEGPEKAGALRTRTRHVAFSPDGKTLIVGTSWKIAVIDLPAGRIRWETGAEFGMGPLIIDPSVKVVAVLTPGPDPQSEPTVSVRDLAKGTELFRGPRVGEKTPLALSPNGKLLAIEDAVNTKVRLFDVPARKELSGFTGVVRAADLAFSADGKQLRAEVGYDIQVWNVSDPNRPSLVKRTPIGQDGLPGKLRSEGTYTTLSGDARTVASWKPQSHTVVMLDASTGATQTTLNSGVQGGSQPEISCVALTRDGSRAVIGTIDGTIVLRDAGQKTRSVPALATLRFTAPSQFKFADKELAMPPERVWISPDGKWLITCGRTTTVWNLPARRQHVVLAQDDGREEISNAPKDVSNQLKSANGVFPNPLNVSGWLLHRDGQTLSVSVYGPYRALGRETVWRYDLTDLKHRLDYNDPRSYGMKSSPDGRYAAAWQYKRADEKNPGTENQPELVILDAQSGKVKKSLGAFGLGANIETNAKFNLAFSADGKLLAAEVYPLRGGAHSIKIWKWESGQEIPTTVDPPIKFLDIVDNGRLLVTGGEWADKVTFHDIQTGTRHHELAPSLGHASRVTMQAFAPVGPVFATGDDQGMLLIRDLATGAERARVQAHPKAITAIGFSSNGQQLATCAADGETKLWSLIDLLGAR